MRLVVRLSTVAALLAAVWLAPSLALAAFMDTLADAVFGQPDFTHKLVNNPSLSAGLSNPESVALDAAGNLYVADTINNRVLEYNTPLAAGGNLVPDRVFGQADFTHNQRNRGNSTSGANSLNQPFGVAIDTQGNLWVSDSSNNRILEYDDPLTSDGVADHVYGQADFDQSLPNRGGAISASGLDLPLGITLDKLDNLYVAEFYNYRVLEFNTPLTTNATADKVFGQADFTHATVFAASATSLEFPYDVAVDNNGNLYIADSGNERVLEYNVPLVSHQAANRVFGQPNLNSDSPNYNGINANGLAGPNGVTLDAHGNLWVADSSNNRVLEYFSPLSSGNTADRVFGQPGFTTNTHNTGGLSAASLSLPYGLALDANDNLYVADTSNNRVLVYRSFAYGIQLPVILR